MDTFSEGSPAASAEARSAVASAPVRTFARFASASGFRITSSMPQVNPLPCVHNVVDAIRPAVTHVSFNGVVHRKMLQSRHVECYLKEVCKQPREAAQQAPGHHIAIQLLDNVQLIFKIASAHPVCKHLVPSPYQDTPNLQHCYGIKHVG